MPALQDQIHQIRGTDPIKAHHARRRESARPKQEPTDAKLLAEKHAVVAGNFIDRLS
jgi:hypothetical protein